MLHANILLGRLLTIWIAHSESATIFASRIPALRRRGATSHASKFILANPSANLLRCITDTNTRAKVSHCEEEEVYQEMAQVMQ